MRRPSTEVLPLTAGPAESRVRAASDRSVPARVVGGDLDAVEAAAIVAAHHAALRDGAGVLKRGPGSAVTRVRGSEGELCVKQYRRRGWRDLAKSWLRPSPARRAWDAARSLRALGIATPEPMALLQCDAELYLVTRFVPLAVLGSRLYELHVHERRVADKRRLLEALGRWLAALHEAGVDHDDCSTKNLLVDEDAAGFVLLDLDGVRLRGRPGRRRRVTNLAQLVDPPTGLTLTDRLRVLCAYARASGVALRPLVREVAAAVRRRSTRRVRLRARGRRRNERRRQAEARRRGDPA